MKRVLMAFLISHFSFLICYAQDVIVNPEISYAGTPRQYEIGGLTVKGVEGYEDYVLTGISGLVVGQHITLPGNEITDAVKRYWKHGLFSKVAISADSIVGDKAYLHFHLALRPRVSNYLLWQIAYSELYFTDTYWPDFDEQGLHEAIIDYQSRQRRFGKTGEQVEENK